MPAGEVRKIPVQRDARTVEQKHKDMVANIRGKQHALGKHRSSERSRDLAAWADCVDDMWNNEMRRIRDFALPLLPLDLFGPSPRDVFAPFGDVHTILHRMNRQAEAMRQLMDSAMDQPMLSTNGNQLAPYIGHGPLDYLKNAYELGDDGQAHFKLRFNLKDYSPNDIEVKTSENGLSVHAKKTITTDEGSMTREFSRTMYLPPSVDKAHFQSHLSEDGILTVEAPVVPERQHAIKVGRDSRLGVKPHGEAPDTSLALQKIDKPGLSIVPAGENEQKVHLEMPLEPEFNADDICVRVDGNRILISGKKEFNEETENSRCSHVKEFTRAYDIPETADTLAVNAQLRDNTLLVEAPLLRPSGSK